MSLPISLAPVFACLILAAAGPAQDRFWNQWRGPDRSGHAPGPAWPERLDGTNLRRQWRIQAGPSYSGPIVDGRHVYTTETEDEVDEVVRALDRKTGEQVWEARWEGSMKVPFFAARNGSWIRSTPALSGDSLYVAGMLDVLVCLATDDGKERWRVDFKERFGTPREAFGFVCSPLVRGDFVYVQTAAGFVKLDKQDGKTVWHTLKERGGMFGGAFSSPVFARIKERDQLLVQTRTELCGVDDKTGTVLWRVKVKSFRGMNILTPQPYQDGVFTSTYGGRGHFFALEDKDEGLRVSRKWQSRAQGYMTSPVVIDGHAYLYLRSKRMCCVDLSDGKVTWISTSIGDEYWSLIAQGKRILALTNAGELYLLAANPKEFEVIGKLKVAESETWAHLAIDRGQIFVREQDGLSAWSWRAQLESRVRPQVPKAPTAALPCHSR